MPGDIYYAGHGAANPDTKINYLIPVDVANAEDDELWTNSINLNRVVESLREQAPSATHYVVFDACRNELNLTQKGKRVLVARGFVPLAYTPGVMIAYATAPGKTASDAGVGAGIYAKALAEEIVKPGLEAVTMFRRVALRVNREIGQDPWMAASTLPEVYLAGEAAMPPPPPAPPSQPQLGEAALAWASIKDSTDIRDIEAYRRQYGQLNPFYDRQAERRIDELKKQVAVATPPPGPKPSAPPQAKPALDVTPVPTPAPGTVFTDCPDCPEMVVVPAGSFTMGSNPAEIAAFEKQYSSEHYRSEGPQRKVSIARPFAVGKFEVTFAEWEACVAGGGCAGNRSPSDESWGKGRRPAINVSWDDAKEYVAWLSRKTGKTYRLLSEAEWEYAARGVTSALTPSKRYWWGDQASHEYANYGKDQCCAGHKEGRDQWENTAPVGQFPANPFGLHDMHGNVWEWVEDCWHGSYQGAPTDGSAWTTSCTESDRRVLRGGSWDYYPDDLRAAVRDWGTAGVRLRFLGFRVGRTLTP